MERTISVMVGKGSVKHNSRVFNASNTDPERSDLNISYCNEDIKRVYHELFGEALVRHNEKKARNDRKIDDYYEKIRSGKQEKPFHEIILQIGDRDDMNSKTADGELAKKVLNEYMQAFQSRNPNMRVFSAHLHMDEATPHLHIDFIPFTTGSKRGLDTRVSLKQALAAQGFKGGTRQETEWSQWVTSEKEHLASAMERHGIQWLQKGTHEKHLSVLDYEKKVRAAEVKQLEEQKVDLVADVQKVKEAGDYVQEKLDRLQERVNLTDLNAGKFDNDPEWQLPEPSKLMGVGAYKTKIVEPFIKKLKGVIKSFLSQYIELKDTVRDLNRHLSRSYSSIDQLEKRLEESKSDNAKLFEVAKDYKRIRSALGEKQVDSLVSKVKEMEKPHNRSGRSRGFGRDR